MMEELIATLLTTLPNFAIAVYVIWRQDQRLDRLLASQGELVEILIRDRSPVVKVQEQLPNTLQ